MSTVTAKLIGDILVLEADDIQSARTVLDEWKEARDRHVWITNKESVDVLGGFQLEPAEIDELAGTNATEKDYERVVAADYVRYGDSLYPLSDFSADWGVTRGTGLPEWMKGWHAYLSDSFFSGLVLRYNKPDWDEGAEPDFTGDHGVTIATYIVG